MVVIPTNDNNRLPIIQCGQGLSFTHKSNETVPPTETVLKTEIEASAVNTETNTSIINSIINQMTNNTDTITLLKENGGN